MKNFVAMQIGNSLYDLSEDALDLGEAELDFRLEEACKVMVHILEDKKGGSSLCVASVGS